MKKEKDIFMTKQSVLSPDTKANNIRDYNFFYWGPILFRVKLRSEDLKKCAKVCNKKASFVNESLAGVIKHEHYISTTEYSKIIQPYLGSFRECYKEWYGRPLTKRIMTLVAWVNFMAPGEFNPPHIHTQCDFSSVLFVKVPKKLKEENKKFRGTGGGPGSISFTYGESLSHSINHMYFFPEEGDLFIFPATLTHFVAPFMSKVDRVSMSANFKLD